VSDDYLPSEQDEEESAAHDHAADFQAEYIEDF
jgi:hypothetical protein